MNHKFVIVWSNDQRVVGFSEADTDQQKISYSLARDEVNVVDQFFLGAFEMPYINDGVIGDGDEDWFSWMADQTIHCSRMSLDVNKMST